MATNQNEIPRVIKRGLPKTVVYDLTDPLKVRITLPTGSTWSSELHWHEDHVEYLKIIQGSVKVRLNNTVQIISATPDNQPEIRVERYAWHEWQRADPRNGEDVVVVERTVPADGEKALFFWNLNGVILDAPALLDNELRFAKAIPMLGDLLVDWWITLNLFIIFHHLDNMPVFLWFSDAAGDNPVLLKASKWANSVTTHSILFLATQLGRVLGLQPVRLKYTPMEDFSRWVERKMA